MFTREHLEPNITQRSTLLPDEAINNAEKFGFQDYSQLLAVMITDPNLKTPFTIAIHGSWGTGKTSLMRTIQSRIESQNVTGTKAKCVWFSAWEFERLPTSLWAVFLNRIIMDLEDMFPEDKFATAKAVGKAVLLLAANYALKRALNTTIKDIEEIKEELWTDVKTIKCLQEQLSNCIEEAIKSDKKKRQRIVIFIDDLDRCLPENSVEIFESIKLFLSCKRCVFIVGVDKIQLRKAFTKKFGEGSDSLEYVEKFVQLEFDLPRKTPEEVKAYLVESAPEELRKCQNTVELISKYIEPNPRKIKRWLNALIFLEGLLRIKQETQPQGEVNESLPSIWLFLKSFFPDFADKVESNPSMLSFAIKGASGKCTDEEKKHMVDYNLDKRLSNFLSSLSIDYEEEQLKILIYLSKIATSTIQAPNIPTLNTEELIKQAEDFKLQLDQLDDDSKMQTAFSIIGRLGLIRDSEEAWAKQRLYLNLDLTFNRLAQNTSKNQLLGKLLELMLRNYFAERYFFSKLPTYTSSTSLVWTSQTHGVIDNLIQLLKRTGNKELIAEYSAALENFNSYFSANQIDLLSEAVIMNKNVDANRSLNTIFSYYKRELGTWKPQIEAKFDLKYPQRILSGHRRSYQ